MCEFCTQHGEGEKWYLTMESYSRELLDQHERRQYAAEFLNGFDKRVPKSLKQLDMLRRTPLMKLAKPILTHAQKQDHYGQHDGAGSRAPAVCLSARDHREHERTLLLRLDHGQATYGCAQRFIQSRNAD